MLQRGASTARDTLPADLPPIVSSGGTLFVEARHMNWWFRIEWWLICRLEDGFPRLHSGLWRYPYGLLTWPLRVLADWICRRWDVPALGPHCGGIRYPDPDRWRVIHSALGAFADRGWPAWRPGRPPLRVIDSFEDL